MDTTGIAAMSMSLSSLKLQMSASVSVAKKAMNQQEVYAQGLLEMIPQDPQSGLGQNIDVSA